MTLPFPARVLVADDEPKIASVLSDYLRREGVDVIVAHTGPDAASALRRERLDLALLDVMLPGTSGLDLLRELRRRSELPVILVTALADESSRLAGLEAGADDYVCKPFSPREVVLRVAAVLRRTVPERGTDGTYAAGAFELDETRARIRYHGVPLDLTTSEYRILRRLLMSPDRLFSRAQLLTELHGEAGQAFDRTIDAHVKNLRRKMATIAPEGRELRSVYGLGYRLQVG